MANDYGEIIRSQVERKMTERASALSALDYARLTNNSDQIDAASDEILRIDGELERLGNIANRYYGQQQMMQQQQPNKWGLSEREREIAEASIVDRRDMPSLTADQKHQLYAHNRAKLQQMKRDGTYDDTQGRVFK
jgi:hypothetical protein